MRRKLRSMLDEVMQLKSIGLHSQSQQKMDQHLELVEENFDQFCTEVRTLETFGTDFFSMFPFQLPSMYFCGALTAFAVGEEEKGMMYRTKSLNAAAAISKNYQKIILKLYK